jgi:hypothetical protein
MIYFLKNIIVNYNYIKSLDNSNNLINLKSQILEGVFDLLNLILEMDNVNTSIKLIYGDTKLNEINKWEEYQNLNTIINQISHEKIPKESSIIEEREIFKNIINNFEGIKNILSLDNIKDVKKYVIYFTNERKNLMNEINFKEMENINFSIFSTIKNNSNIQNKFQVLILFY